MKWTKNEIKKITKTLNSMMTKCLWLAECIQCSYRFWVGSVQLLCFLSVEISCWVFFFFLFASHEARIFFYVLRRGYGTRAPVRKYIYNHQLEHNNENNITRENEANLHFIKYARNEKKKRAAIIIMSWQLYVHNWVHSIWFRMQSSWRTMHTHEHTHTNNHARRNLLFADERLNQREKAYIF